MTKLKYNHNDGQHTMKNKKVAAYKIIIRTRTRKLLISRAHTTMGKFTSNIIHSIIADLVEKVHNNS